MSENISPWGHSYTPHLVDYKNSFNFYDTAVNSTSVVTTAPQCHTRIEVNHWRSQSLPHGQNSLESQQATQNFFNGAARHTRSSTYSAITEALRKPLQDHTNARWCDIFSQKFSGIDIGSDADNTAGGIPRVKLLTLLPGVSLEATPMVYYVAEELTMQYALELQNHRRHLAMMLEIYLGHSLFCEPSSQEFAEILQSLLRDYKPGRPITPATQMFCNEMRRYSEIKINLFHEHLRNMLLVSSGEICELIASAAKIQKNYLERTLTPALHAEFIGGVVPMRRTIQNVSYNALRLVSMSVEELQNVSSYNLELLCSLFQPTAVGQINHFKVIAFGELTLHKHWLYPLHTHPDTQQLLSIDEVFRVAISI